MNGVLLAETAVFLRFHTLRMFFLILGGIVVSVLALCAFQCDSCAHFSNLSESVLLYFYSTKKRPMIVSPDKYNTVATLRQSDFAFFLFRTKNHIYAQQQMFIHLSLA